MMWKSLREEWPHQDDEVWVRYTKDGVNYVEETCSEKNLVELDSLDIPLWRPLEAPEWLTEYEKEKFYSTKGSWREKVGEIGRDGERE